MNEAALFSEGRQTVQVFHVNAIRTMASLLPSLQVLWTMVN